MAFTEAEMLVPEALEERVAQARRAVILGQELAELKFSAELTQIDKDPDSASADPSIEAAIMTHEASLQSVGKSLQAARELVAPEGLVFAIWSRVHSAVPAFRKIDGEWQDAPAAPLRVDARTYPDGFTAKADQQGPVMHIAVAAQAIRAELDCHASIGGVFAYASFMDDARYLINDPDYEVGLLPEPASGKVFVASSTESPWVQTVFE